MAWRRQGVRTVATQVVEIGGVSVRVSYKNTKNLYLRVLPPDGRVEASVPARTGEAELHRFLESQLEWIEKKRRSYAQAPAAMAYESGETHWVWGQPATLMVMAGKSGVEHRDGALWLCAPEGADEAKRAKLLADWRKRQVERAARPVMEEWCARLGLPLPDLRVRAMKTRWGTCNAAKKLVTLNAHLSKRPIEQLEYIVVHELTHLRIRGHGAAFYAAMDAALPGWRAVRKRINADVWDLYE